MPVVGIAEVLIKPVFAGFQRSVSKSIGPVADRAGRDAGSRMGKGLKESFSSETAGLEVEAGRLSKALGQAEESVAASKAKVADASATESKALGDLRVAEIKLQETRDSSTAKASQLAAAEEKVSVLRSRAEAATVRRESAERSLAKATEDLGLTQEKSSKASSDLEAHMAQLGNESEKTEGKVNRFAAMIRSAFQGNPFSGLTDGMNRTSDSVKRAEAAVTTASENVEKSRRREEGASAAVRLAETRLAEVREKGVEGSASVVAAQERLAAAHRMVQSAQDDSARSARNYELAQDRLAATIKKDADGSRSALSKLATDAAGNGASSGRAFMQAFAGGLAGLSAIVPAAGAAGAALLSAAGNAITFAASLSSLGGVAALIPAGIMAIGAGAGVLVTAFAGVGDALKEAVDAGNAVSTIDPRLNAMAIEDATLAITVAEENAAQAQENAARRVADAKQNLQDVTIAVAEAQKAAAKAVEMAERDEAKAARDVIQAQKDLVAAREEAAKRVEDVSKKLEAANLKAVDTALAYKRAVDAYNAAKADPRASRAQLDQLKNNVAKALLADETAKQSVIDLSAEKTKAQDEAVNGSDKVLAAEQKLDDARQAQSDAIQNRKDAEAAVVKQQTDGARQIADAQQAIADATKAAEKSQVDSARAVEQAQRNLERVQMQQADQAEKGGAKSAAAMAALTPAAQESVRALLKVKDMLSEIRKIAQEKFFTGFAAPLLTLANTVMPQLATGVGAIATELGNGAQIFMGSLQKALGNGVLESLLQGVAKTTSILNQAIDPVVQAFVTLGSVGMGYMPQLAQLVADVAKWFNDIVQKAAADGSLKAWIDGGIQGLKDLWSIGQSIVGIFKSLNDAATAGGAVSTLSGLAQGMRDINTAMQGPAFQGAMATLFSGAQAGADGLLKALGPLGQAFVVGAPAMADFLRIGGQIVGTLLGGAFTALSNPQFGAGLVTFMQGLQGAADAIVPLLPGLTTALGNLLTSIAPVVEKVWPSLVQVITSFADGLAGVITFLQPLLDAIAGSPVLLGLLIGGVIVANLVLAAMSTVFGVIQAGLAIWAARSEIAAAAQWLFNLAVDAFPGFLIITLIAAVVAGLIWFFTQTELGQQIIQNVWGAIQFAIEAVADWLINTAMPAISVALNVVGAVFAWLYESMVKPAFEGIAVVATWLWKSVIEPYLNAWVWLFQNVLGPAVNFLWTSVIKPAFEGIGGTISWVWENIIKPVFDIITKVIQGDIPGAFQTGVDAVSRIWKTLQDIAKAPVKFVVDTVINDGLINGFNTIAGILPGMPKLDRIKLPDGFARGGVLPGMSSWRNGDDQLVPMRKGEGVYISEVMRDPYERARLYTMNKAAIAGRSTSEARALLGEGFAKGGIVDPLRSMVETQGYNRVHKGVDYAASVGTPVFATEPGKVSWSGPGVAAPGVWGGNEIHIDGASGIQTWFAHLSQMAVHVGDMVRAGQEIALSGNTGITSGPHLHFGTFDGGWPNDIDPHTYLAGAAQPSGKDSGGFNPFGIISDLAGKVLDQVKTAFPAAGFMIDLVSGVGKHLINSVADWVKGTLGMGSATGGSGDGRDPALYDIGGILPPGVSQVVNRTGKPEAILNPQQWSDIHALALRRDAGGRGDVVFKGNVGWDPDEVANRIETKRRDTFAAFGV